MREMKFKTWYVQGEFMIPSDFWDGLGGIAPSEFNENEYKVMQYTGLKDKNGVEIYEGDICETNFVYNAHISSTSLCQMIFDEGIFMLQNIKVPMITTIMGTKRMYKPEHVEVIGNIYENPELLDKP